MHTGSGHTWGHMVYLIDDKYLFTGDTIWFGADGGYSFISTLAEDNKLSIKSLEKLENNLRSRNLNPLVITGHTGWSQDLDFVFAHKDKNAPHFQEKFQILMLHMTDMMNLTILVKIP